MGEMVERIAIALACVELGMTPQDWPSCYETGKERYRQQAREALKAIREPTSAMLKADVSLGGYGFAEGECYQADPKEVWQAMIDEALK